MIRPACAWVLLILATSPFTPPFSTCDLGVLLGHTTYAQVTSLGRAAQGIVPINGDPDRCSDAYGVSPVVTRIELPRESACTVASLLIDAFDCLSVRAASFPIEVSQSLHPPSRQSAVLRL
jgi:hypothetical protein